MLRSVRARLLLAVGLVVAAAVAAVGVLSSVVSRQEFDRVYQINIERSGGRVDGEGIHERLLTHHRERGGWDGVEALLGQIEEEIGEGHRVFLDDGSERLLASRQDPQIRTSLVRDGMLRYEESTGDGATTVVRLEMLGPDIVVGDPAGGAPLGRLFLVGPAERVEITPRTDFLASLNRRLMIGVGIAGLVALGLTAWLSRRIVGPIGELTRVAQAMERGDLSRRVRPRPVRDEIGELGRAFNAMADGLQRTENLRRRMLGDVAHELRTPLTHMRCQLDFRFTQLRDDLLGRESLPCHLPPPSNPSDSLDPISGFGLVFRGRVNAETVQCPADQNPIFLLAFLEGLVPNNPPIGPVLQARRPPVLVPLY